MYYIKEVKIVAKKEQISIRIDRHLKDKLLIYAKSEDLTLTDYVTNILSNFVEKKNYEYPARENLQNDEKATESIEKMSERLESLINMNNDRLNKNNTLINTDIAVMKNMQKVMAAFKENNKEAFAAQFATLCLMYEVIYESLGQDYDKTLLRYTLMDRVNEEKRFLLMEVDDADDDMV